MKKSTSAQSVEVSLRDPSGRPLCDSPMRLTGAEWQAIESHAEKSGQSVAQLAEGLIEKASRA